MYFRSMLFLGSFTFILFRHVLKLPKHGCVYVDKHKNGKYTKGRRRQTYNGSNISLYTVMFFSNLIQVAVNGLNVADMT